MNLSPSSAERSVHARLKARARIARALRTLTVVPGWRSLVNRLVPQHAAPFVIRNGPLVFAGDIGSYIDRQVYLFGGYESGRIARFLECVPQNRRGTIMDIGANVGTHSLAFSRSFKSVHAFEPNPQLWKSFERNVALNKLDNVRLHKLGLADRDSELTLHLIDKPNFGLGTFSTEEQYDLPLRAVATCPIRHGSNYVQEAGIGPVDAVKIDVQGFEPEVLRGLRDLLERDRPVIWCEIGPGTLGKIATTTALSELVPFPFSCMHLQPGPTWAAETVRLRERVGDLTYGDYVLIPT